MDNSIFPLTSSFTGLDEFFGGFQIIRYKPRPKPGLQITVEEVVVTLWRGCRGYSPGLTSRASTRRSAGGKRAVRAPAGPEAWAAQPDAALCLGLFQCSIQRSASDRCASLSQSGVAPFPCQRPQPAPLVRQLLLFYRHEDSSAW